MKIAELVKRINFHDSNVIELYNKDSIVRIKLDLCMWMQREYKEGAEEIKEITLEFTEITNYKWDSDKEESEIDYDTILELLYDDGIVKIVLEDKGISIVTFKGTDVEFIG